MTSLTGVPEALNQAVKNLGKNCKKILPTQQTLLADAKDLKFIDARPSASGARTVAQIAPSVTAYNSSGSLQSLVGGAAAVILWGGSHGEISNTVLLGEQFFRNPVQGNNANYSVGQGTVLVHELLHYATQLGDDRFVDTYGITLQKYESSSAAISRWLQNDCKN